MRIAHWGILACALVMLPTPASAKMLIPGTGQKIVKVGDDFEDPKWVYHLNLPKSSYENDEQQRLPAGISSNGRWYEGLKRGQPDVIKRVPTPDGGIPGSQGALLMGSRHTGVPGYPSYQNQQDDLIVDVHTRMGGPIPVSLSPNVVVRVYLPPWKEWEQRSGNSFGFRAACQAYKFKYEKRGRFGGGGSTKLEDYWPGMFIYFHRGNGKDKPESAQLMIRSGPQGQDFWGPKMDEPGWWTLGMSFTPDGQVHYFAHAGVEDLSEADHITSQYPYGLRAQYLDTFFFDVVNGDDGRWSTPWIIDDPTLYYLR